MWQSVNNKEMYNKLKSDQETDPLCPQSPNHYFLKRSPRQKTFWSSSFGWGATLMLSTLSSLGLIWVLLGLFSHSTNEKLTKHPATKAPLETPHHNTHLKGRFLHITDIHLDFFYKTGALEMTNCELLPSNSTFDEGEEPLGEDNEELARRRMKAKRLAQPVGMRNCDTSPLLFNITMDYMSKILKKNPVDFILLTGDNSRHNLGKGVNKTWEETRHSVRYVTKEFLKRTQEHNIPIVYTIGNLDVFPKDKLEKGPNPILAGLAEDLKPILPKDDRNEQMEIFNMTGSYFYTLIPNKLVAISVNTMYFAKDNDVVKGCHPTKRKSRSPGTMLLRWLKKKLDHFRKEGMTVYLIGHEPPIESVWKNSCLQEFGKLAVAYRDVIQVQLYGHINLDLFSFIGKDSGWGGSPSVWCSGLQLPGAQNNNYDELTEEELKLAPPLNTPDQLLRDLYHQYNELRLREQQPKEIAIVHTGASIIPRVNTGFRIYEYETGKNSPKHRFGDILDYEQHTLDIRKANKKPKKAQHFFKLTYKFSELGIRWNHIEDWVNYAKNIIANNETHLQYSQRVFPFRPKQQAFMQQIRECLLYKSNQLLNNN